MTRVLIVDDNEENLFVLKALLRSRACTVEEALDGAQALDQARRNPPDLIISDLLMPVLDGFGLLREWRTDPALKKIPFVVYTATYTDSNDEELVLALGADAFIVKPSEPEPLMSRLRDVLDKPKRRPDEAARKEPQDGDAALILSQYNAVLFKKLQKKVMELERANRELRERIEKQKAYEATLSESERRYRTLFHAIADPLFVYDRETLAYLDVNDAAVRKYSYSREEFLNMTVKELRPPEDVPALLETLAKTGIGLENRGIWRHRSRSGEVFDVEISAYGLEYSGRPACLVQARDVTEQRRAMSDAARTTELLKAVADSTPDAVFVKDRQGKYLLFNAAATQYVGKPISEVLGNDDRAVFPLPDAEMVMEHDRSVMESNRVHVLEEVLNTTIGRRTFHAVKAPYRDLDGNVIGVTGVSRDITELKNVEAALRLRDRAIQAVSQGILICDPKQPDNPVIYASTGFERITGYRAEEVIGRNCRFLQGKDTDQETVSQLREAVSAGRACSVEILNYRKDGTPFWNSLSLNPVYDDDGILTLYVGVQNDVTERRQLEDQLKQSQKMQAIGRLAGGVAHDFNNLLTIISGYSQLLLGEPGLSRSALESVQEIRRAGDRAATLTRQLLAFSRQAIVHPTILDVNSVLRESAKMLRRLIGEDVVLTTILAPNLPCVKMDPGQLDQVIMNLAVNARDAMPHGGTLTVETAAIELSREFASVNVDCRPGRHVMITVTDTGCGMTREVADRIFEPFYTTKEIGKGTGLGLATVFGIVQQCGGGIHVESEPGHGATFKLFLPAVDLPAPTSLHRNSGVELPRGKETILVVEDEQSVRSMAVLSLKMYGYAVLTANDGVDALSVVASHPGKIDLVITDVVMPRLSGPGLAETLHREHPDMKILFMSGYTDDSVVRHGLLENQVWFIQKPYTPPSLARKVREVLDGDHA